MKKLFSLLAFFLLPTVASADAVDIDGLYYNLNSSKKTATIVEEDMLDVEIPSSPFDNLDSRRLILSYTDGTYSGGSSGGYSPDSVVQAIGFPAKRMMRIKGNKITHIRFNLWNRFAHVLNMKVFIGSSKDKRDLACQPVADLHEGWNEVALDQPTPLQATASLWVWITLCQKMISFIQ